MLGWLLDRICDLFGAATEPPPDPRRALMLAGHCHESRQVRLHFWDAPTTGSLCRCGEAVLTEAQREAMEQ